MTWVLGTQCSSPAPGASSSLDDIEVMLMHQMHELPAAYFTPGASSQVWFRAPELFHAATFRDVDQVDERGLGEFLDEALGEHVGLPISAAGIVDCGKSSGIALLLSVNVLGEARMSGVQHLPSGFIAAVRIPWSALPGWECVNNVGRHLWGPAWCAFPEQRAS